VAAAAQFYFIGGVAAEMSGHNSLPHRFFKGAGFSPIGSKPAPFAFYGWVASFCLPAALTY